MLKEAPLQSERKTITLTSISKSLHSTRKADSQKRCTKESNATGSVIP